jgi:hypothetical protein
MRYRLVFFVGLGIGFVLGARAGRERYEQLRKLARKVADSPAVQQAAGALQAQAASAAKSAAGAARAKVGDAIHDHVPGLRNRESNGHRADGRYAPAPGSSGGPPEG